jgi:DNA-binding response OmpR family regulator
MQDVIQWLPHENGYPMNFTVTSQHVEQDRIRQYRSNVPDRQSVVVARLFESEIGDYFTNLNDDYRVLYITNPEQLMRCIVCEQPDLVILDIDVFSNDILLIYRDIRKASTTTAVAILCNESNTADEILALELGVNEYLARSINPRIVHARLKSLLKPARLHSGDETFHQKIGAIFLNRLTRTFLFRDRPIVVSATEFAILWCLGLRAGQAVSREQLIADVGNFRQDAVSRVLDVAVSRLRSRLRKSCDGQDMIRTVYGIGYMLIPPN